MKEKRIIRHPKNLKKLVIISGQQRSGKSTLSNLVSTLEGPINTKIDFFLDSLLSFKRINGIPTKSLKEIIKIYLNNLLIDANYGRNLNLKKNEESSIWNTVDPDHYLGIIKKKFTHTEIKKSLIINNEITLVLHNFNEFLNVFPLDQYESKILNIYSHPVDQIYTMYKSKTNFKFNNLSREIIYLYKNKKYCLSIGLEDKFDKLNLMEKILLIKHNQDLKEMKNISLSKINCKYLHIEYEKLIYNPELSIQSISKFLGKEQSVFTKKMIKQNNKKKSFLSVREREKRRRFINLRLRDKLYKNLLEKMINNFNNNSV